MRRSWASAAPRLRTIPAAYLKPSSNLPPDLTPPQKTRAGCLPTSVVARSITRQAHCHLRTYGSPSELSRIDTLQTISLKSAFDPFRTSALLPTYSREPGPKSFPPFVSTKPLYDSTNGLSHLVCAMNLLAEPGPSKRNFRRRHRGNVSRQSSSHSR